MKKETLILKNSLALACGLTIFVTLGIILIAALGFFLNYIINNNVENFDTEILIIFACIIAFCWFVFFLVAIFPRRIIISEDEIKAKKFGKILWTIKRIEIKECIYNELRWWQYLIPMETVSGALQFKLQNGKISRYGCTLSKKQVDKIRISFNYPFLINSTVKEL